MKRIFKFKIFMLFVFAIILNSCKMNNYAINNETVIQQNNNSSNIITNLSDDDYKLKQVIVLSRHNIRAPLSEKGSLLDSITPHKWFEWTSKPSQLSIRGGVLETEMGQFFRKWLEKEGLFEENYDPKNINSDTDDVRIYSNSKQRTIATANYFLTGLFPVSDIDVEHHMEFDKMDPVFNPVLTNINDKFKNRANKQIEELFSNIINDLKSDYKLLEDVIDFEQSDDFKNKKISNFKTDDTKIILNENEEPNMTGSLKTTSQISDALLLQYYESDENDTTFGKNLNLADWENIVKIKDLYVDVLFSAPMVATNVSHPLVKEIFKELNNENRKFTYLCGHDSNLTSLISALNINKYSLPNAIETKTPIGCKLVFSKWIKNKNNKISTNSEINNKNEEYITVDMIYQTVDQIKGLKMLNEKKLTCNISTKF